MKKSFFHLALIISIYSVLCILSGCDTEKK